MLEIITFCDPDDLEEIAGLSRKELWDNNFNLDDCDSVMIINEERLPLIFEKDEWGYESWHPQNDLYELFYDDKISRALFDILESWENYCVGCHYTKYDGKIYISKHHA